MTVIDDEPPHATHVRSDGDRVAEALRTQATFTRAQVASLMAAAMRWGYELRDDEDRGYQAGYRTRVAEENATYPPPLSFTFGRWYDQAVERQKADAAAGLPRPHDFPGRSQPALRAAA